jgi:hypothetical protein
MMPPKAASIAPSDLFLAIAKRPRPHTTVPFPAKDGSVGDLALQLLTIDELHTARVNASKEAKARLGDDGKAGDLAYEELYREEQFVQLVVMACRTKDLGMAAFPSAAAVRKYLGTDEVGMLVQAYTAFRAEQGPMLSELTVPEMNAWLKVLQEGGSRVPLSRLGLEALQELVMHLASLLKISSTASGSYTLPADESSPTPSPTESAEPEAVATEYPVSGAV